jgi:CoA:oxalate CoA-transferase
MKDPHIRARGFFGLVTHPILGSFAQAGAPFIIDGQRPAPVPAPLVGQHNEEIFGGELGLSKREIETLAAEGIL